MSGALLRVATDVHTFTCAITMVDLHDAVWVATSHTGCYSDNGLVAVRHSGRSDR
jgi:hypothetical protein